MVGHGRSSAGSYLADPTSLFPHPLPLCCNYRILFTSVPVHQLLVTSTVRVKMYSLGHQNLTKQAVMLLSQEGLATRTEKGEKISRHLSWSINTNINVHVYSLEIPVSSVDVQLHPWC